METVNGYQISGDWTDLNTLSGIAIGQQITLHNAGRAGDIIEVAVSAIEPLASFRGVAIKSLDPQYRAGPQENTIWVRYIRYDLNGTITPEVQHKCLLNVQAISDIEEVGSLPSTLLTTNDRAMRLKTSSDHAKTAFGEVKVESVTPITQISGQYGLLTNVLTVTDTEFSGTNYIEDNKFTCESGVDTDGLASITTLRQLSYRAGQGAMCRLTIVFDSPVADNVQAGGFITAENSFTFAYVGTNFGILHAYDGMDELQELTLTNSAGSESATVTIDGTPYIVPLTGTGTVQGDAFEIAVSLNAQVPNYTFTSNDNQVAAQALLPAPQGGFAYTSAGSSAGSWDQLIAGMEATQDFIPQAFWNGDPLEGLNPQMGNVYQIQFQYLGFGAISFFIEDSDTGAFVMVHQIKFANNNTTPSVSNPTFRVGWLSSNSGNTTSIKVQGSSAGAFIEGTVLRDTPPRSSSNDQLAIDGNLTNILSFRNRISFGGKVNRAEIFPNLVSGSSQTNKAAIFKIILNPTYSEPVTFHYEDKSSSIAETTMDKVEITGGREIGSMTVTSSGGSQVIRFNQSGDQPTAIFPGTTVCLAAEVLSGQSADCQGAATWTEDL